jgi:hypothetical protein
MGGRGGPSRSKNPGGGVPSRANPTRALPAPAAETPAIRILMAPPLASDPAWAVLDNVAQSHLVAINWHGTCPFACRIIQVRSTM